LKVSKVGLKAVSILLLTVLGFAVMGYHPGIEDDGVYLAAIKADLQPDLYPHDSEFFRLQLQATIFDRFIAGFVRATSISIPWAELLWQLLSLYGILWAAQSIARQLFPEPQAQWAGVAMVAALFTLPVAGTALYLADQHLHPRNLATALILAAVSRIMSRKPLQAIILLLLSLALHPIMAAMGISFCFFLSLAQYEPLSRRLSPPANSAAAALPLSWIFQPASPTWRRAVETRRYYFLFRWTWYEWLGALAPIALFWLLWRAARSRNDQPLARFALGTLMYGIFQFLVAAILLGPSFMLRLAPLQPMRFLHLVYVFMALLAGCLLGRHVLKSNPLSWLLLFGVLGGSMFASQRILFSATEHLELPGRESSNPWLQAFSWIRRNTPSDAYFALDPNYLAAPGEDFHGFRALAERSQLADSIKDTAVVTQVPQLGPEWAKEIDAQAAFNRFQREDFDRLRIEFDINWVLVRYPPPPGLMCRWHNSVLVVCPLVGSAPGKSL
jgi:hypothetical protein